MRVVHRLSEPACDSSALIDIQSQVVVLSFNSETFRDRIALRLFSVIRELCLQGIR